MKTPNLSALVLLSLSLAACGGEAPSEQAAEEEPLVPPIFFEDLNVHRVHNFMITQLGTEDAWDRTRYMEFDFIVRRDDGPDFRRSHQWDKWEQKARVEWTQDEEPVVVVLDALSPPTGQAWIGSELVTNAAQADSLVQRAYGAHINDAYWLVMPYKWKDPGVTATWLRRETADDGRTFEVIELSFDQVGLTPQNRYHAYVNTDTWRMERWAHFRDADAEPRFAEWGGWQDVGPLVLSLDKGRIQFENVRVFQGQVPDGAFSPPA